MLFHARRQGGFTLLEVLVVITSALPLRHASDLIPSIERGFGLRAKPLGTADGPAATAYALSGYARVTFNRRSRDD